MRYYVVSQNVRRKENQVDDWMNAILKRNKAFLGWDPESKKGKIFHNIKIGDLVLIARREKWKPVTLLAGIADSQPVYEHLEGTPALAQNISLKNCITKEQLDALDLNFDGTAHYGGRQIPGIYELHPEKNAADKRLVEQLNKEIENKNNLEKMEALIEILKTNYNLVLTGAPGTGKTYLAKQLALIELFKKDNEDLLSDDEKKLLEQRCAFVQFHPSYDYTDFVEGLRPKKEPGQKEIGFELKDGIFMEFCKRARNDKKNAYFFIIDEINRAEISKVFGELFFSIDPGYRGEKGKVKTQYANLREEADQYFYVPENVYIIGTMNDIDRSVESFDFAMRRRFVWKEILAEVSAENMNLDVETKSRMAKLNEAIENIESLNSSYHIGAAYFLKLKNYNNDYDKLWKLHLKPLVQEYLRGIPDASKHFDNIENSFLPDKK